MTALEHALAEADRINREKREAIKAGANQITYEYNGKIHHLYYHGMKWRDRPSSVGDYHGQI